MTISLRHNALSFASANELGRSSQQLERTLDRVSSGSRISRAADDAAGSAVSVHLSAQANSTLQGIRNAQDGISIVNTAEAGLNEVVNIVERCRELAVQSASGTLQEDERTHIQTEFNSLRAEVSRISETLEFNGINIASGDTLDVQVGTNASSTSRIEIEVGDINNAVIGLSGINLSAIVDARAGITRLDTVLDRLTKDRADLGAVHNRLSSAIQNAQSQHESLVAASSRIQDSDMAFEASQMTALSIRQQAGTAAISQANQMSSSVVSLI